MNEGLPRGHLPYHFLLRKAGKPSVIANSHCWAPQHSLGWLFGKVTRARPRMVLSQRCHCQLQMPMRPAHVCVARRDGCHPSAAGGCSSHPAAGCGPPEGPSNSVGDRVVERSCFPALKHMNVSPAICFQPAVKRTIINK